MLAVGHALSDDDVHGRATLWPPYLSADVGTDYPPNGARPHIRSFVRPGSKPILRARGKIYDVARRRFFIALVSVVIYLFLSVPEHPHPEHKVVRLRHR